MSRKLIITLAAAATVAAGSLASTSTYARSFGSGGHMFARGGGASSFGRGSGLRMARNPGHFHLTLRDRVRPGHPIIIGHLHPHHHWHWAFRDGRWIEIDDVADEAPVDVAPAAVPAPGPCTCLTKTYTPAGLVVFADVCTKESVSAPASGDTSDATQAPSTPVPAMATPIAQVPTTPNYAGRTYEDYLAAQPQAAQPQAAAPAPQQTPPAPQQN